MHEALMSLNSYNTPEVLKDQQAIYTLLIRLILLEPGTIQSHPEMGIGIKSKYRYGFADDVKDELMSDIQQQIATYLPEFQDVSVEIEDDEKTLMIQITVDGITYEINLDDQTLSLKDV